MSAAADSRFPRSDCEGGRAGAATWDGVTVLTLYMAFLFVLPARWVVASTGAIGRPAALLGILLLVWWAVSRLVPGLAPAGRQPLRAVVAIFALAYLIAYVLGFARGLPAVEASGSDRSLLTTAGLIGLMLITADACRIRSRLDTLLRRLSSFAGLLALVGVIQFFFGIDLVQQIRVPGLVLNNEIVGIATRGDAGLNRVAGTTSHYIEFGVVLAMLLPIAVHFALYGRSRGDRQLRWLIVALISSGSLLSVSRSAVVALGAALFVLAAAWCPRLRFNALVIGGVSLVAFRFVVPGLLGTILSLFENTSNDPSIQGRQNDYPVVFGYLAERPWFGRGPGTFLPEEYILLDNQILGTLVSTGIVGLSALLLVFFAGWRLSRVVLRNGALPEEDRHLAAALCACVASAFSACFTFDSLGFPVFAGSTFLLIGASGALSRLVTRDRTTSVSQPPERRPVLRVRRAFAGR